MLDQLDNRNIKIIIMSATINSLEFSKYFSTSVKDNSFLHPEFEYVAVEEKKNRGLEQLSKGAKKKKSKRAK